MGQGRRVATVVALLLTVTALPALAAVDELPRDPELRSGVPDDPDRLAGATRFETAARIARYAQRSHRTTPVVLIARSDGFADALAAGSLDTPILFVPRSGPVPPDIATTLDDLGAQEVRALGGEQAVPEAVLQSVADGRRTSRIEGADRYETAVEIARQAFPGRAPDRVYVARSDLPVDALAGGFLGDGPVLLVPPTGPAPQVVTDAVDEFDPDVVVRLGGPAAVATATLEDAAGDRPVKQLAGDDRFETAAVIAEWVLPDGWSARNLYLARADQYVDALAAGALDDGALLLVDGCAPLPDPTAQRLEAVQALNVVALGGPEAVCDKVVASARREVPDLVVAGADDARDRVCTDADDTAVACRRATRPGEVIEAWIADDRGRGGELAVEVRVLDHAAPGGGVGSPVLTGFGYEDPQSDAAIRYASDGSSFDVEVQRPDGSENTEARERYVDGPCRLGFTRYRSNEVLHTLRMPVGTAAACFREADPDTWELTVELTTKGADGHASVDHLTITP